MNETYHNLLISYDQGTCLITIAREKKLNALNKDTLNELHQALVSAFKDDAVKGILLTGQGQKAFVAGADISEFADFNVEEGRDLAREGHNKVFNLIHESSKPIVAAINGFALGGGLELALACHIRIAATGAKMGLPEVSLGLIPGYGGTQRLTHLVGRGRALEMILSGDMIDAEKALSIGLVNEVVSAEALRAKAQEILARMYSRSPKALAAAIRAVNASVTPEGYEVEIDEFSGLFGTGEFVEGVSAFLEKRKPNF